MKRGSLILNVEVVFVVAALLVGCGGGSGVGGSSGPGAAVVGWYNAMNAGKHSDAEKRVSSNILEMTKGMGGIKGMADELTHKGTMTKIEVTSEEIRGEGADVGVRVTFKDGSVEDAKYPVIKQDGVWKVTI